MKNDLASFIEHLHRCKAIHFEDVEVNEEFDGQTVWSGVVSVFKINGHPKADTCYGWSSPIEGSDKRKFYAILKLPPVQSPSDAVKAAIASEYKSKNK